MTTDQQIHYGPARVSYDDFYRLYIVEQHGWIERVNPATGQLERLRAGKTIRHGSYQFAENARQKAARVNAEVQP